MSESNVESRLAEAATMADPVAQARVYHALMADIEALAAKASQGRDVALKKANLLGQSYGALAETLGVSKALIQQRVVAGGQTINRSRPRAS